MFDNELMNSVSLINDEQLLLREKCPNTEIFPVPIFRKNSVFGHFSGSVLLLPFFNPL